MAISRLRRRLGDDSNNPTRIKTVRQKGYLPRTPGLGMSWCLTPAHQKPGNDSNNSIWIKTVRQKGYLLVPQAWE